jgi:hypothetical protein
MSFLLVGSAVLIGQLSGSGSANDGGRIVILGVVAVAVGVYLRVRHRNKRKQDEAGRDRGE